MFPIIEELLSTTITNTLTTLQGNPSLIDSIFTGASDEAKTAIKQYVTANQIKVIRGFPRDPAFLPVYAIVLGSENEQPTPLGSVIGDDNLSSEEMHGILSNVQYRVETWSNNADLTVHLYYLLKWIILSNRDALEQGGLFNQSVSGADLEPVPLQVPELIYRRGLTISGICETRWSIPYGTITGVVVNQTISGGGD